MTLDLLIVSIAINELLPAPRNARRHNRKQIRKLAKLIAEFGFVVPILIDRSNRIIAGHARAEAAKLLWLTHIPAIYIEHLTPAQIEMLALAENRISDDAGWSAETLSLIMSDLSLDATIDLSNTAFEMGEIDFCLADQRDGHDDGEPEAPARDKPAISRIGDVYRIGCHLIVCGDALVREAYLALVGDERAVLIVSDNPFNVPVAGHVSGTNRHPEFPMASGEMSEAEFTAFLTSVFMLLAEFSVAGSIHFHFMDHRHLREILAAGDSAYSKMLNLCVWVKKSGGMGSLYRSQHELIFVFKSGDAPHINNVELGKHGRTRTNVWQDYAGANTFGKNRAAMLERHPTSKNVKMIEDAILDCSNRGDIVLDPFLGSGTTIVAAHRAGRVGRGIELDPYYVDVAVRRIAAATGEPIVHVATGLTFAELEARRTSNPGDAA